MKFQSIAHVGSRTVTAAASLLLGAVCTAGQAHAQTQPSNRDQPVVPQVDRRDVKLPRIASKDFEIGAFLGTYSAQNFGSNMAGGLRLGYHLSEDFFVELGLGQTKVSDETYRQILPGGIFANSSATLRYTNLSIGWNVLPGEVFIGKGKAKATSVYLLGGVGSTSFVDQRKQTFNVGLGMRLYLSDRTSMRVDIQDHVFSLDLLGKRETTQNPELTVGLSFYF